jgi:lysophospholipase L1-like esterase
MADAPYSTSRPPDVGSRPSSTGLTPEPSQGGHPKRWRFFSAVLIVSLTLNVVGAAAFAARVMQKGGIRYLLEQLDLRDAEHPLPPYQVDWRARFRKLPNTEAEIVFAGDSLIAEGPWSELYCPIKNRGIGGETTTGLLDRLDEVTESRPRKIFLLVGTNCLAADVPVAQVVRNYRKILERVRGESPQSQVFVISVLPVNPRLTNKRAHVNATIRELNRQLRDLAGQFESVAFLDVFDALTDGSGDLRKDLTTDGLHLNLDGYLVLGRLLEGHVVDRIRQER